MKKIISIKLKTNKEEYEALKDTLHLFNEICNDISLIAFNNKVYSKYDLQKLCYYDIKEKYPDFSSQLIVRAIKKVVDSYKITITHLNQYNRKHKEKKYLHSIKFKKYSAVVYDCRILSYKKNNILSIWTIKGRLKLSHFLYKDVNIKGESDLILKKNSFYLLQTIEIEDKEDYIPKNYLGIDLGIVNIAYDSDGTSYSGEDIKNIRNKYSNVRESLQSKNTRSSKRKIKKLSNKESRFVRNTNHCISKSIVKKAKDTYSGIKLEDLENFFNKKTVRKSYRYERNSWSFRQLIDFILYKAKENSVTVEFVNPAYTSSTCPSCGYIDKKNRKTQERFLCVSCKYTNNADYVGAINIRDALSIAKCSRPIGRL